MKRANLGEVINASVNEVLSRTVVTSLTVFLVLLALFFFGGVVIHDFAFALLVGVIVGTYSSVFVASPVLYAWRSRAPRPMEREAGGGERRRNRTGQQRARG
jgi:preprotein translocase subunit SecF